MKKSINFISGGNWSSSYYTDYEGNIYDASTGSDYIEEFIEILNLEVAFLEYHPDLVYFENGVSWKIQKCYPSNFENFKDIPKWTYCKNPNIPLIEQLNENEFKEFHKFNTRKW
ncbi:radical SAM domain-containing protein [Clostridium botulinum B str. Osaka05]|uniref:Radical SAM domain-containing protein n=1 Tax=Clostridium botulinum B str. Osaka05 TaxID=1407017 RepID=A0A060N5F1_CLOBO|nr:hypothetical protein [Clostridium botulinum]BAO04770.1 radical SAM domain-containing protein [Clostridium botulinum B str. Osaka05]